MLSNNVQALGERLIKPVQAALAVPVGKDFAQYVDRSNRGGAAFLDVEMPDETSLEACSVPKITLAELRARHGDYHLAKLDLEGCELAALKADQAYLHAAKPILIIEASDTPQTCQIANYCRWLGYTVAYADMPVWRKDNPNGATEPIFSLAHEALLIAAPLGKLPKAPDTLEKNGGRLIPIRNSHDLVEALWLTPR